MRIKEIANLINNANVCVDVGSDHAHLSLLLIENNKTKIVYNLEKNDGPLKNSIENTKKHKHQIFNLKSDGFKNFNELIEIDYCTISGMGANTIIEILDNCKNKISNFIICSNNNYEKLREWIKDNNYRIFYEKTVLENDIYYEIICFSKNKGYLIKYKSQIKFGHRNIKKFDLLYIDKLKYELNKTNYLFFKNKNTKKYNEFIGIKKYIEKYDTK